MFSARETLPASPSISRLLSTSCVWMPKPDSSNRMFSSRVPKRLSTPRLMRTLALIKRVDGYLRMRETVTGFSDSLGRDKTFDNPLARVLEQHLLLLYRMVEDLWIAR